MPRYDPLSPAQRSERMSRILNADTKPEMIVRRLVHGMGYRYALHVKALPGNPDLVFRPRSKVIFVHGCFWHQHRCRQYRMPKTKHLFWEPKLAKNKARDGRNQRELRRLGWRTLTIWECQLKTGTVLKSRIKRFLGT
ncbi:MAG: very short patch repair endonuclease [Verrucomicrobia bacterium]|nr:very short patch repair endonuclease [Verrucomicrobiota bacterium]MBU1908562.1 very short patch repair endonuclease [Verrucomicrobiota bacterium]